MGQWLPFFWGVQTNLTQKTQQKMMVLSPRKHRVSLSGPEFIQVIEEVTRWGVPIGLPVHQMWLAGKFPSEMEFFFAGNFIQDFPAIPIWWPEGSNSSRNSNPFRKKKHILHRENLKIYISRLGGAWEVFTLPRWKPYEPVVQYEVICNLVCSMQNKWKYILGI